MASIAQKEYAAARAQLETLTRAFDDMSDKILAQMDLGELTEDEAWALIEEGDTSAGARIAAMVTLQEKEDALIEWAKSQVETMPLYRSNSALLGKLFTAIESNFKVRLQVIDLAFRLEA